jgi:hypothetical protein
MLFDSCINCTRQESNCVRETLREISNILQISRSTAQTLHACETSTPDGPRSHGIAPSANQPKADAGFPDVQGTKSASGKCRGEWGQPLARFPRTQEWAQVRDADYTARWIVFEWPRVSIPQGIVLPRHTLRGDDPGLSNRHGPITFTIAITRMLRACIVIALLAATVLAQNLARPPHRMSNSRT